MTEAGFQHEDRAFLPHLTLARASNDLMTVQQRHLEGLVRRVELPEAAIPVSQVSLMRSILDSSGAIYHELANFPLQP
jgi:2'-5' RNA ligase